MKLTASNVNEILLDCLYDDADLADPNTPPEGAILVHGILHRFGLNPDKVAKHKVEIKELVEQLPEQFKDGQSFLCMCDDKEGYQWGEHHNMEELVVLGVAAGYMKVCMRELQAILPGGIPYVQTTLDNDA